MADLEAEGMDRKQALATARAMVGQSDAEDRILLPVGEHPLIRLVLACHRQWRLEPIGLGRSAPVALDLVALDVAARWLGITPDARLLDGLSIMEREALKLMRTEQ